MWSVTNAKCFRYLLVLRVVYNCLEIDKKEVSRVAFLEYAKELSLITERISKRCNAYFTIFEIEEKFK